MHHHHKRSPVAVGLRRKRQGRLDDDGRAFSGDALGRCAVAAEAGIEFKKVVVREGGVEAHCPGIERRMGLHGTEVPFTKMAGAITRLA